MDDLPSGRPLSGEVVGGPLSSREILDTALLEALRQQSQTIRILSDRIESLSTNIGTASERLVRLESEKTSEKLGQLELIVRQLQTEQDKRTGAVAFIEILSKTVPWLVALMAAVAAYVVSQKKV